MINGIRNDHICVLHYEGLEPGVYWEDLHSLIC